MKKSSKIYKRFVSICLVMLLGINSFAAQIADNDGSAFITKSEFDSLRSNFQTLLNQYNTNIDNKIDVAISQYLAGVKVSNEIEQTSLLNRFGMPFTSAWNPGTSSIGDKLTYSIGLLDVYYKATGDAGAMAQFKVGSGSHDSPKLRTTGSSNSYYILYANSNYNSSLRVFKGRMESYMLSSAIMYYQYGAATTPSTSVGGLSSLTVKSTATYWEVKNITQSITLYGRTNTMSGIASFGNSDTITKPADMNRVSGNSVPTGTLYIVKDTEINYRGNEKTTGPATSIYVARYNGSSNEQNTSFTASNYKVQGYLHKYDTIASGIGYTAFIIDSISQAMETPVYYYSGLPLFTANTTGKVTIKLSFTNTAAANTTWQIKEGKFTTNGAITAGLGSLKNGSTEYTNGSTTTKNTYVVPNGITQTVSFDVQAGKSYWIKANPASGYSTVKTTSIKIKKDS